MVNDMLKFGIEYMYKPNDRTCQFQYQWLEIFGLLDKMYIEISVAFLKTFSILLYYLGFNKLWITFVFNDLFLKS